TAFDILRRQGLTVHEMPFGRDALYVADEIFMTGTAAEITPVREVDRRVVGPPGPITKRVQQVYQAGVRGEIDWLRPYITTY
ncbi:MAG: branched chain amino acid aminotransferase, partial [Oligoflexia bacterium]|nr:branched chain amino acid aminotransferase [Oligoflexia bacterium]